jgi:hypothetical protein
LVLHFIEYCPVFDGNFGREEVPMESTAKQDKQCTYKRNIEPRSCNNCCSGKSISITYSERVFVDLGIQRAKCMRRNISSSVAGPAVPYFSTLSYKRHDFRKKKVIEHKMWGFIFFTALVLNISHSKNN